MTDAETHVSTLDFQLENKSANESLLHEATLEAMGVSNETILGFSLNCMLLIR